MGVGGSFFPRATSITMRANSFIIMNGGSHPADSLTPGIATRGDAYNG
jgi:hypothetical protein